MSTWTKALLGDIAQIQTGPFGSQLHASDYQQSGIPVIMPTNIRENLTLDCTNIAYITEADAHRLQRYLLQQGDIIYSRRGAVERCAFITHNESGWLCGTGCLRVRFNPTGIYPLFFAYYFSTNEIQDWVIGNTVGTTMPNLNSKILEQLPIVIPPLSEQQAIADVLSSLDAKIDLLRRQNTTLETMAETLFRQWFIEEAREEWETKPLSSIANFLNGLACQKYPPKNAVDRLPVLKIKELTAGITEESDWATTDVPEQYHVHRGDVIFAWSASLMVVLWHGKPCILNQHLFKVTSSIFPKWFYLLWCKHHLREFILLSSSHATTMGHIKRGDLDNAMVRVPSPTELDVMSQTMNPLIERQITNTQQIQTLEQLRDTLLPKLMSGEVRVVY